jgi:anhydro-N-acetylmuramic acid kinase
MEGKNYNVIGVMSGTSLDGVDIAYLKVTVPNGNDALNPKPYQAEICLAETISYTSEWSQILTDAVHYKSAELVQLNEKYTKLLAQLINSFIAKHGLSLIDTVCSHGHTVIHKPEIGLTLQIGNLPNIATLVGKKVVCDFRVQDVELGGQGAPLVPIGDQLLFGEYDYCLNLGGFANVSLEKDSLRIAYDICAVNTVLNVYAQKLGKGYDDRGAFAKAGTIHHSLLEELNSLPFYKAVAPKSLGIEWVHETVFPLIERFNLGPKDILATFTKHIAIQLVAQFERGSAVLVTGGGAYNTYLLDLLKLDPTMEFIVPDNILVEYKEALIFGLLGVLKLENKVNTLASVTGASKDHSAGKIYLP